LNVEAFWGTNVAGAELELVDAAGKAVIAFALPAGPGPKYVSVPLAQVPDGVYVLRVKNTGLRKKVVVLR
jgi:hypothetical protein